MYDSQQKAIQDEKDNKFRESESAKDEAYRQESLKLQKYNAGLGHYDEKGNWTNEPDYSQVDFS
jgi:hypothetical protein